MTTDDGSSSHWDHHITWGWLDPLPSHLAERCKVQQASDAFEFVLHWMRTSIRLEESATFDVAEDPRPSPRSPPDHPPCHRRAIPTCLVPFASIPPGRGGGCAGSGGTDRDPMSPPLCRSRRPSTTGGPRSQRTCRVVVVTDLADLPPWRAWTESVLTHRTVIRRRTLHPSLGLSSVEAWTAHSDSGCDPAGPPPTSDAWPPCDLPLPSGEHLDLGIESVDARAC